MIAYEPHLIKRSAVLASLEKRDVLSRINQRRKVVSRHTIAAEHKLFLLYMYKVFRMNIYKLLLSSSWNISSPYLSLSSMNTFDKIIESSVKLNDRRFLIDTHTHTHRERIYNATNRVQPIFPIYFIRGENGGRAVCTRDRSLRGNFAGTLVERKRHEWRVITRIRIADNWDWRVAGHGVTDRVKVKRAS